MSSFEYMEAEPPEPPTALRVKDVTKNSLTLSWDAPYDKEGITGYTVERRHIDDDNWERVTRLPGQVTSHHIRGLPDGESFYFRVSAENAAGSSKPTELKTPVELKGRKEKPSAILNAPEVIEIGPKYAELSWQPPESDGGSPLTGYFLERIDISGFSWLPVNKQPILDTHYRVENLYEELQYQFRVRAANKEGLGEPSPATDPFYCRDSFKLEAPKFSKEIEDTSALEGHEAKFTCEVTGLPRPEVTWYRNFREVFGGRHCKISSDGNVHMMVVKDLEEGETSYIECHAKNRCGSATTRAKLDVLVPAKIIDLSDRYLDGLSICKGDTIMLRVQFRGKPNPEVTWSVDKETIEAGRGTDITTTPRHTSLMIYDSDRSDGGVYTVTVKNKHGSDTANIPIKIIDRPQPPSGKPAIISFNKFSVKLAWNEPEDDGGSPVTGYIIEKCDLQTGVWRRALTSKHPQCTVECLEEHKEYKFRILSENFIGISQPGEESDIVVTRDQAPELDYDELFDSSFKGTNVNVDKMKGDVLGKYIICEELGRGAFGVVHRAIERATDKNWAAKFIRCRPQEKELVRHEIEIMNQLHHPKLMQLHEAFDQTGEMVMILELLSGGELFDRLVAQDYEFTEEDCIVYMRQICQGVRHMHQQNIIHLDLKPENVMCVTKDTRDIKLIDFGLAQKLEEGKSVKVLFGTAEFCAPEIISFEPVSFCSDMWSIGVVSYVLLSGYSPFAGDTDQETFTNINQSDYDFSDDVWDNISDDARDFINKLLARDRSKRMTIDEALAHPWLNPRAEDSSPPKPLVRAGAAEKKLTGTKLSTQHHKDYLQRKRHREDELDILPIGRISRDSAIFRREGEQGVIAKNIIMELPPHAPVFCEPLTDVSGFEGSRIEMTCKISAKPAPRIKWFKDGEELQDGKKYHMTYSDYYASLFISDLDPEDAGKYRCKAFNDLGEDSTTGKLTVEEILHRRKRKEELESLRVKYPKHDYDLSLLDSNIPPSFTLPLIDQVKHVGEDCEFTVTVTCRPEPEVTWFHNNEEVHESEAFEFVHSKGVYRLIIHGVETLDAGQWRCEAVNKYGHSWCSCDLKVIDKMPEGGEPPVFIRKLQDTTIVEGSSVHLECKVKGQPNPEIEWYKDRKLIRSGRHYAISKEGSTCILTIHEAFPEDTGKYMCRAVNTVSSATTEAQLRVQKAEGEESEFLFEHYVPDEARLVEKTVHFKIETEPNFTATLKDKSATLGTHVKMLCSITGIPAPRVIMYHNDIDVTGDDHYMITNNHGLVSLEFYSVKHSDAGRYTCKAVNSEGEASCQARLQVLDVEEEAPRSPDYVRPSFTTPIHDLTVTAGDEASFSCVAIGKPMPGFKWQKDMVDISDSHRIFMGADSDGAAELIIRSARVSDSGLYSCVAQSSAGRTKCSAYLRVLAKSKSRSPPGSPETEAAKKLEQRYERARMEIPGGRAPRFTEPLPKVVELDEGDKLRLECEVEGYPKPKVTWYKATRNLTYDYRHRVKVEQTMHILEVNDVTVIDSGEFIAKATNDLGEAETRCIVRVNRRRTEKEREVTTEAAQRAAAPFFIKHLPNSIDVMEGMNVQLDCIVEGDVTMVKYKRAEAKVVTEHFQSGDFEGTYHEVPMASIPTMSMPGAEGGAGSRPRLNIPEQGSKRAPRFVEEMEDGTIVTGSIATMSVVIDANPAADVSWYKDGKKIKNTDHYETYLEDGANNLEIFDTLTSDTGLYRCVARNEMGSAECQCKLEVKVRAGEDSFSTPSYDEEESGAKDAGPRKFPPRFVVELEPDIMVAIGDNVKLVCIIDDALDRVHWEKDGKKMSGNSRTKIVQETDGTQQLELSKAVPSDQGIYSCIAITTSGETVTTETKLCVTEEKSQPLAVGAETKPKFTSQLKDIYCKDGEEVTLECEVTGLPRPQMTWHKDKHEILDSQDFQISTIGNKCRLTIAEVFPEDEGRYICKAINSLGEATASCQLLVEGQR